MRALVLYILLSMLSLSVSGAAVAASGAAQVDVSQSAGLILDSMKGANAHDQGSALSALVNDPWTPRCGLYDGQSCPTNGGRFRCFWQQYEPGMCFCRDNVWECG
ncbi:hypothetical protein [Aquimonas voraii]|uniref:Uncharacterized protein n=1 Tax=Aquimonas voraii TaxID=265719 RepID=A0A1G6YQS0_9GAMM|nr:hypothetical protein [Aquimonas voraii]SDD91886.1 hypothetical protein SAMN04488509_11092 [Aquimonas voraii]